MSISLSISFFLLAYVTRVVTLPGLFAVINVHAASKEERVLVDELINAVAFFRVSLQAHLDKVLEVLRPFVWNLWDILVYDSVKKLPPPEIFKRRKSCG